VQLTAAAAPAYFPSGHNVQAAEPVPASYDPGAQCLQAVAPAPEYWPTAQFEQAPEPLEYVPASQLPTYPSKNVTGSIILAVSEGLLQ